MPCYPALALLLGNALSRSRRWLPIASRIVSAAAASAGALLMAIYVMVYAVPAPGDISNALTLNPQAYTLSLGHMRDLTLSAFAYLKTPVLIAAAAFLAGAAASWRFHGQRTILALALMMIAFFHAARIAMQAFDPYLSSASLAHQLKAAPTGQVIFDNQYYTFSSVFFYADLNRVWLLNGRVNNLEYGSYAPQAPQVFLTEDQFAQRWQSPGRYYLFVEGPSVPRILKLIPAPFQAAASGGKFLYTNHPLH